MSDVFNQAAVAVQPMNHLHVSLTEQAMIPCYCIECCEKVTHRAAHSYPNITSAPHDRSFLDMQFGLEHAKRLTAKQYCEAMTAMGHAPHEAPGQ